MPQTFYEVVWIFIIYAFIGWCTEVAYAATERGIFINRGFLNGPYCPIYGCGVLIVVITLTPIKDNLLILYAGSFLLTSILEFITGFVMEKIFHNKWWDYSDKPFNIMGYVCLKFSLMWGLACTFIMRVIHPIIYGFIRIIPHMLGAVIIFIVMICFAVDFAVTVSTIVKFNKELKLMNEIAAKLKLISNEIGENVYEKVMTTLERRENFSEFIEKAKLRREQEDLVKKFHELYEKKSKITGRLMKAFPEMKSIENDEILQKLKKWNVQRVKRKK